MRTVMGCRWDSLNKQNGPFFPGSEAGKEEISSMSPEFRRGWPKAG